jgi:dienelactone hydrolase
LDYLLSRPDVDPARIELVGTSLGAPFATIAAALDPRVSRLWIVHGGGEPYRLIEHGLEGRIPFMPARTVVAALATLLLSGPSFAPERWVARVAPRQLVMINALEDERIPRRSIEVLWAAAGEPKEIIWLPGPHVGPERTAVLTDIVDTLLARASR